MRQVEAGMRQAQQHNLGLRCSLARLSTNARPYVLLAVRR